VSYLRAISVFAFVAALAACEDPPTMTPVEPGPGPAPAPLGVYEVSMTGIGGPSPTSTVTAVPTGPEGARLALTAAGPGISIEQISASSFIDGARGQNGQRYISFTYRVRNGTGAPLVNVTAIPVIRSTTVPGTPFSQVKRFDGTDVPVSVAPMIVPTGAVALGEDGRMRSLYPDAIQAFTEAEVASVVLPAGVTGIFPYGFVIRNPSTPGSRTLPVATGPNDYAGVMTLTFRLPLQSASTTDVFAVVAQFLAVQDSETRMTESIEESQDTAGVRRLRERASQLGATTVTVLPGSPAQSPFVVDYPGQRTICTVRTAGTVASPATFITAPAGYARLGIYRTGETLDPCAANFTAGTAEYAHYGMPYTVTLRSMDRYGNVATLTPDTVTLASSDGTATMPAAGGMTGGSVVRVPTYVTYGNSMLYAKGRRLASEAQMTVWGMTRTWTGNVNTLWAENGDWVENMTTGVQDSVIIPGDRPNYPLLVQNQTIAGVTMTPGATVQPTINLSSFDLTVNGSVALGTTGMFAGTGRLLLGGPPGSTIGGGLSNFDVRNLRVLGTYSVTSNINVTGGRIVVQGGRLRNEKLRIRVRPS
jgi:hypothetical protein